MIRLKIFAAIFLLFAVAAPAQQPRGRAIAVPVPDARQVDLRKYEVVELSGAQLAEGSFLVDGQLPLAIVDYSTRIGEVHQRVTIFENGIVSIDLTGAGADISKRVLFPPEAVKAYRKHLSADALAKWDAGMAPMRGTDAVTLRIHRSDGTHVERSFRPTSALPETIESQRRLLQDLIRVLSEDREVTNPISGYKPKVGDVLFGEDQKAYEIVRLIDNGEVVELVCRTEPVRRFVPRNDLSLYFFEVTTSDE